MNALCHLLIGLNFGMNDFFLTKTKRMDLMNIIAISGWNGWKFRNQAVLIKNHFIVV